MQLRISPRVLTATFLLLAPGTGKSRAQKPTVDLTPRTWGAAEEARFEEMRRKIPVPNPLATGRHGAVTGTYNAPAMRAGLEALQQGGSAADAAITTALAQIALVSGSWVSYTGIYTMVYYDASNGEVTCLNAGYNTVKGETDPKSIPAANVAAQLAGQFGSGNPSGRTALVPGFMAGAEAAHKRYGKLSWASLFGPAIYFAKEGFVITPYFSALMQARKDVLTRLPATRAVYTKSDGSLYAAGDLFKQPALAKTLQHVADDGAEYMYHGEFARRMIDAVQAEGGKMTLEDLANYKPMWVDPARGKYRNYEIFANGPPDHGGLNTIETMRLYELSGLVENGHYSQSPDTLFWLSQFHRVSTLNFLAPSLRKLIAPSIDLSLESRLKPETTASLWELMKAGKFGLSQAPRSTTPQHSDAVVAIDRWGNMAAVVHSINTVMWGGTGIVVDGVSVNDSASFQQAQIAEAGPGTRLPGPTNPLIVMKNGRPVLASSSMGSGLHRKTTQCLINVLDFGMNPKEANDAPYLMFPEYSPTGAVTERVLKGFIKPEVLDAARAIGLQIKELPANSRFAQGLWVGITFDPETGQAAAGSSNVTNGQALAVEQP